MNRACQLIVFHGLPKTPCIDGLIATALLHKKYSANGEVLICPYTRTKASLERVFTALQTVRDSSTEKKTVTYVDVTPEFPEEIELLTAMSQQGVEVEVKDHHDTKVRQQLTDAPFKFTFDPDRCGALLAADDVEVTDAYLRDVLTMVQFSEYEGMNPRLARKEEALGISRKLAAKAGMDVHKFEAETNEETLIYFILDQLMAQEKDWTFLNQETSIRDLTVQILQTMEIFMERFRKIFTGEDTSVFAEAQIAEFRERHAEARRILEEDAAVVGVTVKDAAAEVLVAKMSIVKYGRSLEPLVRAVMEARAAHYTILVNPPSNASYYLSLRRVSEPYSARDLAARVCEMSGSRTGGGHPWASGATLSQPQYEALARGLELDTLLLPYAAV